MLDPFASSNARQNFIFFCLAIRHGEGGLTSVDLSLMSVACAGVAGWLIAGDPMTAHAWLAEPSRCSPGMLAEGAGRACTLGPARPAP